MSRRSQHIPIALCCIAILAAIRASAEESHPKPYRLPSTSVKNRILWGSAAEAPDGTALSFGGEDQDADDGAAHSQLRVNGTWRDLSASLNKDSVSRRVHDELWPVRTDQKNVLATARFLYLDGHASDANSLRAAKLAEKEVALLASLETLSKTAAAKVADDSEAARAWSAAATSLDEAIGIIKAVHESLSASHLTPEVLREMRAAQVLLEKGADELTAEPPPRALSPIVFDPKSRLFVLFGGDHGDYLTNDLWVFDSTALRWSRRRPPSAPAPRANHRWTADGNGKLTLTGGYTYFSNTDYMGGQYVDISDGDWTYDVAANTWSGGSRVGKETDRTYRTGPFLPEHFFVDVPPPDGNAFQKFLQDLPANRWTKTAPPQLPKVNRDWGTAVIDPDRDLILRWAGGHCAHGGTDVLEYHLATNRWELCYPVEFPLGQLYDNTEYPHGVNFNRRPWITGHTYQNYGVDPLAKKMLFVGQTQFGYVYDPDLGDWGDRLSKPAGMSYASAFYSLTTTPTPQGLVCWTNEGKVFRFTSAANTWRELPVTGTQLAGAEVDNSTVVYDSRRDRLLFFRKPYGDKTRYDGDITALDMKSLVTQRLSPAGKDAAGAISYLCQIRYDADNDLLLVGATLPPDAQGIRRTPAYDCATNKWIALTLTGDDPSGPQGRNVSLGLMYDARRKLFWAVDAQSNVFVLRLEPKEAQGKDI